MKTDIKEWVRELIKSCRHRRFSQLVYSYLYSRQYKNYAKKNGIRMKNIDASQLVKRWSLLSKVWETTTFKYYANYIERVEDIVPESIGRTCLEPILNPLKYRPYYADKNMFAKICGKVNVPNTLVCRIGGGKFLDSDLTPLTKSLYEVLGNRQSIILKPTIDSKGGHGVMLFNQINGRWMSGDVELTEDFLIKYGRDFAIQEIIKQHDVLASLNPTSVNTTRLTTYRSFKDEKAHVLASIIRVGGAGMFVDNACSGGKFASVDVNTGKIGNYLMDSTGRRFTSQNGLDYQTLNIYVPGWNLIKEKCLEIAENIPHHRLIAFDMTITQDMKPMLIEYNIESYSYWFFHYTNQAPLGEHKDEIFEYCKDILKKVNNLN